MARGVGEVGGGGGTGCSGYVLNVRSGEERGILKEEGRRGVPNLGYFVIT